MKQLVVVGLVGVATVLFAIGVTTGHHATLIAAFVAIKAGWLVALVQAGRAREWWWAVAILVIGVIPAVAYSVMRSRGPRTATEPISLLRA
jgi:hypothetical protein